MHWSSFSFRLGAQPQVQKLGAGDAVRVTVFQQPDLTTEARISEKGTIACRWWARSRSAA